MHRGQRQNLSHFLGLALGLFAIWVLLSGKFETKFLLIGLVSSLIISYLCLPFLMIKNSDTGKEFFVFGINYVKFFFYSLWLLKEIFKSSVSVSLEIIKIKMDYEPRIVFFSMPYEHPIASVLLTNSIILTPGTITLDVSDEGVFEVHALTKAAADDLLTGVMAKKVAALFGETCEFRPMPEMEIIDIPKEVC